MQGGGGLFSRRRQASGPQRSPWSPPRLEAVNAGTCVALGHLGVSSSSACLLSAHARTSRTGEEANCSLLRRLRRCGNEVLGGVEPNRSLQRRDTRGGRSATATELECRRSLPGERVGQGQSRRWCGRGKSELLEGASPNGSELRGVTTEHDV
ncbi:hypothetical protein BJV77DRAFT_1016610 [Russula vinacea]|nr:hypothetical protein BJV77DRAFT_1016610 [Russula vinacea]